MIAAHANERWANNLSWLRRFAVSLLKRHSVKDSLRGKMVRCMMNTDFLTEVLTIQRDWYALAVAELGISYT
jgi:hypothetical protein